MGVGRHGGGDKVRVGSRRERNCRSVLARVDQLLGQWDVKNLIEGREYKQIFMVNYSSSVSWTNFSTSRSGFFFTIEVSSWK